MTFLAPLFFVGLAAIAIPILVHLIQRERKEVVAFPSLMFIRRIPYQSVERRRLHNWPLLLLRTAAMALVVAAFTRPFVTQDPVQAQAATEGAREVVILLDRSASMGYGDHFARAQEEARRVVAGLGSGDHATLVLFGTNVEERVRRTPDQRQLDAAIGEAAVTSQATRYGPALRLAQSLLSRSSLPRKQAVLISDFQRSGWERHEEIRLPEGAELRTVSVATLESTSLSIASVAFQRATFSGEERVTVTAGLTNRGARDVKSLPVSLEIDGRVHDTRPVTIGPNASGSVTFPPVTVAQAMRATVRAGADALPADNNFHFVLAPSRPVSVLIVQADGTPTSGPASPSVYLTTAMDVATAPRLRGEVMHVSRLTPSAFERRAIVVLNDASPLSTQASDALQRFVEQGGGLLIALGERTPWNGASPLLPGTLGGPIERGKGGTRGGTIGFLDHSHPVLEPFKDPRNGTFADARYLRYRRLEPAPGDQVLARFDDGAAAMVERRVGSGRVIAWTTTLDTDWNSFATRPLYPVVLPLMMSYLAQYSEPQSWYTVGSRLDIATPVAALVREGNVIDQGATRRAAGLVLSPSGEQQRLGEGGAPSVELIEQGFYSVRLQGADERRPYMVAVNLDPAESDLTPIAMSELANAATGRVAVTNTGESLERPDLTPQDIEKKQSLWWYLLLIGVLVLLGEAVLSNRQSRRFTGVPETART